MPALSDAELKTRLEAHNYQVPPITATTRGLLQKKLAQLDGDNQKSGRGKYLHNFPGCKFTFVRGPSPESILF